MLTNERDQFAGSIFARSELVFRFDTPGGPIEIRNPVRTRPNLANTWGPKRTVQLVDLGANIRTESTGRTWNNTRKEDSDTARRVLKGYLEEDEQEQAVINTHEAKDGMEAVHEDLQERLGAKHPLTIKARRGRSGHSWGDRTSQTAAIAGDGESSGQLRALAGINTI